MTSKQENLYKLFYKGQIPPKKPIKIKTQKVKKLPKNIIGKQKAGNTEVYLTQKCIYWKVNKTTIFRFKPKEFLKMLCILIQTSEYYEQNNQRRLAYIV
ncbi:MAG: hypothetical protein QXN36_04085 [Candidatus Bathyarchaeia archaeon]